jgi:hypothetical protein
MEDAPYKTQSMGDFTDLKLDYLPDKTTILKLWHFLKRNGLDEVFLKR